MTYTPRIVDAQLSEAIDLLPAIHLAGAKGVGKTSTAETFAQSVFPLDDRVARQLFDARPERILEAVPPVLIDEWQRSPEVWDLVRRRVDRDPTPGRFLLTGSAYPRGATIHSGAGRIISLRMRPFSLAERGLESPTVSLDALLSGGARINGESALTLESYVDEIVASGFPGIRAAGRRARPLLLDGYIDNVLSREFAAQGLMIRAPETLRRWLRAYAAAAGTTASYAKILDAATPGKTNKPAKTTTIAYRDVLESLWLLDEVPPWIPDGEPLGRLAQTPKHFLADPGLAARLLDAEAEDLLENRLEDDPRVRMVAPANGLLLGRLFEQLVALSLSVYAPASGARLHHLRTRNGDHEVDFIVTRKRAVVAIEVTLSASVTADDVRHLHWLRKRLGPRLTDSVVITTGPEAYRRSDGIAVIPAALLGL